MYVRISCSCYDHDPSTAFLLTLLFTHTQKQDMDLSLRLSSAAGLADPEIMEQNLQEWIIHRSVTISFTCT